MSSLTRRTALVAGSEPAALGLLSPAVADQRGDRRGTSQIVSRRSWLAVASATPLIVAAPAVAQSPEFRGGAPRNPDADLIALCDAHAGLMDAVNRGDDGDVDEGPAWLAYTASCDAIDAAEPQTIAGMLAKARAAKAAARMPNGTENPENCNAGTWAWC